MIYIRLCAEASEFVYTVKNGDSVVRSAAVPLEDPVVEGVFYGGSLVMD